MSEEAGFEYADILHHPVPNPKRHRRMPIQARAAQFAPFAALTGYESAIEETERLTQPRIELDNAEKLRINEIITHLLDRSELAYEIRVTYFKEDSLKNGGMYLTHEGHVKKIDPYLKRLIFSDGIIIEFSDIYEISEVL